jgi:WD40 repeat protein/energy-coupling factor transporter ATP-binding protein EcfA2
MYAANNIEISNPFPGLRAFEEHEDVLFFGREKQVDELLKKLRTARFMAVIGSSGSGKSSLVKSGLIPALYAGFMSGVGSQWRMCTFRPGNDPIGNMARALAEPGILNEPQNEEEQLTISAINESVLRRSSQGLVEVYRQSAIDKKINLLVLVDQFEEIFRFSRVEKDAREGKRDSVAFINLLLKATEQRDFPIYVVFTMRSDFLGDCTEFRGLPEAINEGQYLVPRMTRDERRDAITGPIAVGGASITPRLLNQLLNDVGDNPDQLPILQHALMRTWSSWKQRNNDVEAIDISDYESIGTMKMALSLHAEEAYAELLTQREQRICEVLFKAITDKGSDARGIRRPRQLGEICMLAEAPIDEVVKVIDVFRQSGRAFLMPPASVHLNEHTIIDISHESLMRVWDRLMAWVDEENESAQVYLRLCEASDLYETGRGGLWRDPELQVAWKWKESHNPNATWASRYNDSFDKAILFLTTSKQAFEQELKLKEERQRKRLIAARRVTAAVGVAAVFALFLAIYSFQQKNLATKQTLLAQQKTKEALEQKSIATQQKNLAVKNEALAEEQKLLAQQNEQEALEQKEIADQQRKKALVSEQNALLQKNIAEQQKAFAERQRKIAEENEKNAKEQKQIAEQQTQKAVYNEGLAREQERISTRLKELAQARNLAYQSNLLLQENRVVESKQLAFDAYNLNAKNNGPLQNADVYNALMFNYNNKINNNNQNLFHQMPVKAVTSYSDNLILTGDEGGTLALMQVNANGTLVLTKLQLKDDIRILCTNKTNKHVLAATASGIVFVFAVTEQNTLQLVQQFKVVGTPKATAVFKEHYYIATTEGLMKWSYQSGQYVADGMWNRKDINHFTVSTSGKFWIANGNKIEQFNTWGDWGNVQKSYTLNAAITSVAIDASETYLAIGAYNGTVWLNNIKSTTSPYSTALHLSSVDDVRFSELPSGKIQLATAGYDQTIKLLDVQSVLGNKTEDVITLRGHTKWIYHITYLPKGNQLVSVSEDAKVIVWYTSAEALYAALKN